MVASRCAGSGAAFRPVARAHSVVRGIEVRAGECEGCAMAAWRARSRRQETPRSSAAGRASPRIAARLGSPFASQGARRREAPAKRGPSRPRAAVAQTPRPNPTSGEPRARSGRHLRRKSNDLSRALARGRYAIAPRPERLRALALRHRQARPTNVAALDGAPRAAAPGARDRSWCVPESLVHRKSTP